MDTHLKPSPLPKELYDELVSLVRGPVLLNNDSDFMNYATIFNGNVVTKAKAVVCPLDAEDVSKIVVFCNHHGLSPSVKAGGYGTAGWAIGGDIIIDLSKIVEVDIERPLPDGGGFTSLRDVASANSKGKAAIEHRPGAGKRRREEDAGLRVYDDASHTVASLLTGPLLSELEAFQATAALSLDGPSPAVRRRLDGDTAPPALDDRQISTESGGTTHSGGMGRTASTESGNDSGDSDSTVEMSLSPSARPSTIPSVTPSRSAVTTNVNIPGRVTTNVRAANDSPFGFLDEPVSRRPVITVPSYNPQAPMMHTWGPGAGSFEQMMYGTGTSAPVQAEAIYPHVYVTFGAGMRQKEIDTYTAKNKLEARYISGHGDGIPYHIPFSAHPVGSSIMLLGGFGFLSRLHGLSVDNLVEVEMVLADGRIVVANENEHTDLWWALRGGGTVLGVATRYKAKAYPVPVVFAGNLIYRFRKATAPSLIKHFRDCVKGAPRELYANVLLTAGPQGKDSLVVVQLCYVGSRDKGQEYLTAISSWSGERCLLNEVDEKSFLHQQDSVAQVLRGKAGRQWFIRSALISSLPDDIIHTTVLQFADTPVGCTWLFELAGGAVGDFEDSVVPKGHRNALFTIAALHQWEMDANDDRCIDSAEEWIADTLKPVHIGGAFPSFLGRHEAPDRIKASFGENWDRLVQVKQKYDPRNVFNNSFWPLNEDGEPVDPRTHEPATPEYLDSWQRARI